MSKDNWGKVELSYESLEKESPSLEGTQEETIAAINSVPGIRAKEKIIANLPDSARFIKGYPVLKEGHFNQFWFPDEVLQRDAGSWMEHEKGMTRKMKNAGHDGTVKDRVAHITDSYYDNGFVKQDFLILNSEAIEQWDQGFLDDPSIAANVKIDPARSKPNKLWVTKLKGIGTDFEDIPACKTCGLDAVLAQLSEAEPETPIDDEDRSVIQVELEDKEMKMEEIKAKFDEFIEGLMKDEEPEEDPVEPQANAEPITEEPVVEEPQAEPVVETPVVEAPAEPVVEEPPVVQAPVVETPVVPEMPVVETPVAGAVALSEDQVNGMIEAKLAEARKEDKQEIAQLKAQLSAKDEQEARGKLVDRYVELSGKFKITRTEDEIAKLKDTDLESKIDEYEALLKEYPEGQLPDTFSVSLAEQQSEIQSSIEDINEKRKNAYIIGKE